MLSIATGNYVTLLNLLNPVRLPLFCKWDIMYSQHDGIPHVAGKFMARKCRYSSQGVFRLFGDKLEGVC